MQTAWESTSVANTKAVPGRSIREIEQFSSWIERGPFKPSTKRVYQSRISRLHDFMDRHDQNSCLSTTIESFLTELENESVSVRTFENYLVLFRLWSRFVGRPLLRGPNEFSTLRHQALSDLELERLVGVARRKKSNRDLALVLLLLRTDVRIGEIPRLTVADPLLTSDRPAIRVSSTDGSIETRYLPIQDDLKEALMLWLIEREKSFGCNSGLLFPGEGGKPIGLSTLDSAVRHLGHRARLDLCARTLRSTYFSRLAKD